MDSRISLHITQIFTSKFHSIIEFAECQFESVPSFLDIWQVAILESSALNSLSNEQSYASVELLTSRHSHSASLKSRSSWWFCFNLNKRLWIRAPSLIFIVWSLNVGENLETYWVFSSFFVFVVVYLLLYQHECQRRFYLSTHRPNLECKFIPTFMVRILHLKWYNRHAAWIIFAAEFLLICIALVFSTDAMILFSSGATNNVSLKTTGQSKCWQIRTDLRTPTIKAVWMSPPSDKQDITARDIQ